MTVWNVHGGFGPDLGLANIAKCLQHDVVLVGPQLGVPNHWLWNSAGLVVK